MIKSNLSGFVVTMHSGLCEQYVQSLGLTASGLDFLVARTLLHYDNNPRPPPHRAGFNPLILNSLYKLIQSRFLQWHVNMMEGCDTWGFSVENVRPDQSFNQSDGLSVDKAWDCIFHAEWYFPLSIS